MKRDANVYWGEKWLTDWLTAEHRYRDCKCSVSENMEDLNSHGYFRGWLSFGSKTPGPLAPNPPFLTSSSLRLCPV